MFDAHALDRLDAALHRAAPPGVDARVDRARRRAAGVYFTPPALVEFVVDATLSAAWAARPASAGPFRVLDPAAGDGRFLAAAARWIAARTGCSPAAARRCVIGIERDPALAARARDAVGPGAAVHCAEALLGAPAVGPVDAVVGNPPYVRSVRLERSDPALHRALRGAFAATSHREWDLYGAFIERSLAWLAPWGRAGLVVPSRWLTGAFAARLRAKLAANGAVAALVDFGERQIFAGATTYAAVVWLARVNQRAVRVARWVGGRWRIGSVDAAGLGAAPWRLATGATRELLDELAAAGPPLGRIARIAKGAGTNADRVFVIERGWSRALAEPVDLEPAATRPVLRGRDVAPYGRVDPDVRIVYPYDDAGRLVPPDELPPRAAAYLARCRDRLEARERGRYRGARFYRFGRPQNLAWLADPAPKIVVPDVARTGRAMVDAAGAMVLDSAYAVRPLPGAPVGIDALLDLLNSPVVDLWLRETGLRLRGGYVRMKTAYLASLPVCPPSLWSAAAAAL